MLGQSCRNSILYEKARQELKLTVVVKNHQDILTCALCIVTNSYFVQLNY